MAAPDLDRVLGLARPSDEDRQALEAFHAALRSLLCDPWVLLAGRPVALADYLDAVRAAPVTGDEHDVVDRFVLRLLACLGYGDADIAYNRRLFQGVPDIAVRLSEVPASLPEFIVEDKATDVRDFLRPRPGADGQRETPYEQLRRYIQGGGVQGRQGLLCNGFVVEAWEFGPDGGVRLAALDLAALGRAALDGPWPGPQAGCTAHAPDRGVRGRAPRRDRTDPVARVRAAHPMPCAGQPAHVPRAARAPEGPVRQVHRRGCR